MSIKASKWHQVTFIELKYLIQGRLSFQTVSKVKVLKVLCKPAKVRPCMSPVCAVRTDYTMKPPQGKTLTCTGVHVVYSEYAECLKLISGFSRYSENRCKTPVCHQGQFYSIFILSTAHTVMHHITAKYGHEGLQTHDCFHIQHSMAPVLSAASVKSGKKLMCIFPPKELDMTVWPSPPFSRAFHEDSRIHQKLIWAAALEKKEKASYYKEINHWLFHRFILHLAKLRKKLLQLI